MGDPDDTLPTPNVVPVADIFDAVRRAIHGVVDLRMAGASARLADQAAYRTETVDIVTHIPEHTRAMDAEPVKTLVLPGFDPRAIPCVMREAIERTDWTDSFPCHTLRPQIVVSAHNDVSTFRGNTKIEGESFFYHSAAMPGDFDPRKKVTLSRFSRGVAKKTGDFYRAWIFIFDPKNFSIYVFEKMTEEDFNHYFTREVGDSTLLDIDARVLASCGFCGKARPAWTSIGSLSAVTVPDFSDTKLKLPSGYRSDLTAGNGVMVTIPSTQLSRYSSLLLMPLKDGRLMRVMLSEYEASLKDKGAIVPLMPARIWDRKSAWVDATIKVNVAYDEDHVDPVARFDSGYPEIDTMMQGLHLNRTLGIMAKKTLPPRAARLS